MGINFKTTQALALIDVYQHLDWYLPLYLRISSVIRDSIMFSSVRCWFFISCCLM